MSDNQDLCCVFCKETFEDNESLQIHFRKHGDPNFNTSNEKSRLTSSKSNDETETSESKIEAVSCDVCTETFSTISKAITHKHKFHPNHSAKYFCCWCGKLFTMKHLHSKHLANHKMEDIETGTEVFHCDCCEVDFYVPAAMIYHNKYFHRQDIDLPAIGFSQKQTLIAQELIPVYYCSFCGEEYINKVNLHKHLGDDHGDEDQCPNEVLRCPLCEAVFYHLDAYEVHLTCHSKNDIYNNKEVIQDILEYTLESVPPLLERVEDEETPKEETAVQDKEVEPPEATEPNEPMDLNSFLELVTKEKTDGNNEKKSKKHKKHKKSKKVNAITLDEFLSMNADVFGDQLDFQGVEEVPTQVVKRKLKTKPKPSTPVSKHLTKAELNKLKQQGIVVKVKPSNESEYVGIKVISKNNEPKTPMAKSAPKPKVKSPGVSKTVLDTSNEDVLSKLMNQSQCQLKIVKKTISDNPKDTIFDTSEQEKEDENDTTETNQDSLADCPKEAEIDTTMKSANEDLLDLEQVIKSNTISSKIKVQDPSTSNEKKESEDSKMLQDKNKTNNSAILKNISQQITIKQVPQKTPNKNETRTSDSSDFEYEDHRVGSKIDNEREEYDQSPDVKEKNKSNNYNIQPNDKEHKVVDDINGSSNENSENNKNAEEVNEMAVKFGTNCRNTSNRYSDSDGAGSDDNSNRLNIKPKSAIIKTQVNKASEATNILHNFGQGITIKSLNNKANINYTSEDDEHKDDNIYDSGSDSETQGQEKTLSSVQKIQQRGISIKSIAKPSQAVVQKAATTPASHQRVFSDHLNTKGFQSDSDDEPLSNFDQDIKNNSTLQKIQQRGLSVKPIAKPNQNVVKKAVPTQRPSSELNSQIQNDSDDELMTHPDQIIKNISSQITVKAPLNSPKFCKPAAKSKSETVNETKPNLIDSLKSNNSGITIKSLKPQTPVHRKKSFDENEIFSVDDSDSDEMQTKVKKYIPNPRKETPQQKNILNVQQPLEGVKSEYFSDSDDFGNTFQSSDDEELDTMIDQVDPAIAKLMSNKNLSLTNLNKAAEASINSKLVNNMVPMKIRNFPLSNVALNQDLNSQPLESPPLKKKNLTLENFNDSSNEEEDCDDHDSGMAASDDENQIVINKLKSYGQTSIKSNESHQSVMMNKVVNSNVTMQSSKNGCTVKRDCSMINKSFSQQASNQIPMKQAKLDCSDDGDDYDDESNDDYDPAPTNSKQIAQHPMKQLNTANQQTTKNTVDQVSTSVRTVQTKTVVQEITTTVTRTVKTINQAVNQECSISSNSQVVRQNANRQMVGQRPRGPGGRSFSGTVIRQAVPFRQSTPRPMGPRSAVASTSQSRQHLQIRQASPNQRQHGPRPVSKPVAQTSGIADSPKKVLKISPNLLNTALKVSKPESTNAGCFKRPNDVLKQNAEPGPSSRMQNMTSSSQVKKTSISSKMVKSNSTGAIQTQSEMKSSFQQVRKVQSSAGTRVESSQFQVERSESTSRSTQDAIDRLRRQGLLVKRPKREDDDQQMLAIEGAE